MTSIRYRRAFLSGSTLFSFLAAAIVAAWPCSGCDTSKDGGEPSGETDEGRTDDKETSGRQAPSSSGKDGADEARVKAARAFADLLLRSKFSEAEKRFTDQMRKALPAESLEKTWRSIEKSMGGFKRIASTETKHKGTLTAVILTAEFSKGSVDIRVVLNEKDEVAGLFFKPTEQEVSWQKPGYADPSSFIESQVEVGEGKYALPATLTLPKRASGRRVCGAVLVHGSGPHDRDETIGGNKPFKDLAWGLATRGIAVVRYEKRTLVHKAKMSKEADRVTIKEETVDDAVAAARMLRDRKEIHPGCVVIVGHSLGGNVAPLIGKQDPKLAGLVLLAANTRPLQTLVLDQHEYLFSLDGKISKEEKKKLAEIKESLALLKKPDQLDSVPPKKLPLGLPAAYWKAMLDYDPVKTAKSIAMPMLILQGERDYQVTMEDLSGWKKGLSGKKNVSFKSYPKLNHLFIAGKGKPTPGEYTEPGHVAKQVIVDIVAFINASAPKTKPNLPTPPRPRSR